MHLDYDHLRALSAILRTGSFEGAAADLGVTPPAISQRLKALEDRVGARLIVRASPCTATALGRRLARHMEDVAVMEAQLLPEAAETPRVTLAVNADSLGTWLVQALAEVPQMRFDLRVEDQDHSSELLKSGDAAAAITARAQPVQGCDAIPLGALAYVATAAPDFVARWFADGVTAESLETAPALIYSAKDALQSGWAARVAGRAVRLNGHVLPSTSGFVDAACVGLGWGMNPEILVREHLSKGRLVAIGVEPDFATPLYWQIARRMRKPLEPLTHAVRQAAQAHLVGMG